MIETKELAKTVWQMRELQKSYFRNRTPASLGNAKAYEHKVDVLLRDILFPPMSQLFPIGEDPWSAPAEKK